MLCQAPQIAIPSSSTGLVFQGMQDSSAKSPFRSQEHNTSGNIPVSYLQSTMPQSHPSESTQSGRNTPSEQSVSKGQLGDDECSSDEYESAQSGPDEAGLPPPRSSSLFIGDKNGFDDRIQPLPKSTNSSAESARTTTHQTANAGFRNGTQSPRSTNSSNKTPTQLNFDHSKAMPSVPYPLEWAESPQDPRSALTLGPMSHLSADMQPSFSAPPESRSPNQNLNGGVPQEDDSVYAHMLEPEASSTDQPMNTPVDSEGSQPQKHPSKIQTTQLLLPTPTFSPLLGEHHTGLSMSPTVSRDPHSRGLSIGSIPSALDPERPPSPVSPFVPPGEDPLEEERGRPVVPVHHGVDYDFVEESSVERARRRSQSFSRPFQIGQPSGNSLPFDRNDLQDHPAFRPSSDSGEAERPFEHPPNLSSNRRLSRSREQAPEYQGSGQGAPDMPVLESKPRSRRGSRSSTYLKVIRDSVSPSRKSQARERSQPSLPDSSKASDSPHSVIRASNLPDNEEKPRRSSIFGRTKTNNSSRSDQAQSKENPVPRAATMPVPQPIQTSTSMERPVENNFPASSKMSAASRFSQRLQRASTTVNQPTPEQDGGKKKRFSGIGSLFGRSQKRQNLDQFTSIPPQQHQQYGRYTGRPRGSTQRFPLDDEPDDGPPLAQGRYAPHRIDPPRSQNDAPAQPQAQPQKDLPAYVQNRMLRQSTAPVNPPRAQQPTSKPSSEIFHHGPNPSPFSSPQPTSALNQDSPVGSRPPPAARSTGSWSRFSQTRRANSNSRRSQPTPPPAQPLLSLSHTSNFVSSSPLSSASAPKQRSWIEDTSPPLGIFSSSPQEPRTENQKPVRLEESPPPPPPPPKDERWADKSPIPKSKSNYKRTGSMPLQPRSSPATEQRQSLPPLQTNVPSPRPSAISSTVAAKQAPSSGPMDKENMTPEEKRKSRQEEIEKGHLTPGGSATSVQGGKMSVLQEDEGVNEKEMAMANTGGKGGDEEEEETILMSATSFPGQMWQPDSMAWEGE